ncbi:MAG: hypothetical protein ACTHN7_10105 [Solirubrobacterales bacterium]
MATKLRGEKPTEPEQAEDLLLARLDADVSAPRRARRAIETLGDRLGHQTIADLRSLVTELVAISLSSPSRASIEIRLRLGKDQIRGEIRRSGGATSKLSGGGHALRIIGSLVEEWGLSADRADAWFHLSGANQSPRVF